MSADLLALLRAPTMIVVDQKNYERQVVFGRDASRLTPYLQHLLFQDTHTRACSRSTLSAAHTAFHASSGQTLVLAEENAHMCKDCRLVMRIAREHQK